MTRRSRREIERDVDELESESPQVAGLISVLSTLQAGGAVESIPGRPDRIQINGEEKPLHPNARAKLEGWVL